MADISASSRYTTSTPLTATVNFLVGYPIYAADDILVRVAGVSMTKDVDYTVTFNPGSDGADAAAEIDLTVAVSGVLVEIIGLDSPARTDDVIDGEPNLTTKFNGDLDHITANLQELRRDVDRAVSADYGASVPEITLAAGKLLSVDDGGNIVSTYDDPAAQDTQVKLQTSGGSDVADVGSGKPLRAGTNVTFVDNTTYATINVTATTDINGLTAETSLAIADELVLYDASEMANNKMTAQNLAAGLAKMIPDGAVGAPSLAFNLDQDSGLYRVSNDVWALVANGAEVIRIVEGGPTAPTQSAGDNSTKIATTAYVDALPITKQYHSSGQTITSGGLLTLAHGLGVKPKLIIGYIKCTTAEDNFAVADEVEVTLINNSSSATSRANTVYADATNVYVRFASDSVAFSYGDKTGGAFSNTTNANWDFYVRAFA